MKKLIFTLASVLLVVYGFAQTPKYTYNGPYLSVINMAKLNNARLLSDVMTQMPKYFVLSAKAYNHIEHLKKQDKSIGYFSTSNVDYTRYLNYSATEISVLCSGILKTAKGSGPALTDGQRELLLAADMGANINIKVSFNYKDEARSAIDEVGEYNVTVVPETEAVFPGGNTQLSEYFTTHVVNKLSNPENTDKMYMAVVNFTVLENGRIVNARIERSSSDAELDRLLLEAASKMPDWNPAKNAKGINVKQEYSMPLGGGGC